MTYARKDHGHQTPANAPTLIASAQRALRLLEAVARYPRGATAKQLARDTGLALGTAYHLLRTLVHDRYLERREGHYLTGPAVAGLTREESPTAGRGRLDRVVDFDGIVRASTAIALENPVPYRVLPLVEQAAGE
ncbi:helix-turn-helix domain-containing protein [Kitasatospora sp. McL0602]|uniref:helix-turn-helix domain-containing protein n=1 Tax=Kitasatospora sp. McL0602 TaxID=3439530 RepID=UPI003F899BEE